VRDLLDAPCGWGRLVPAFGSRVERVTLVDLDPERLDLVERLGLSRGASRVRADLLALPLRSGAFDFVLSAHLNYHLPTRAARIAHFEECLRVARRAVLLSVHSPLSPRRALRGLGSPLRSRPPMRTLSTGLARATARERGFALEEVFTLSRFSGHRYLFFRARA